MNKNVLIAMAVLAISFTPRLTFAEEDLQRIIVRFAPDISAAQQEQVLQRHRLSEKRSYRFIHASEVLVDQATRDSLSHESAVVGVDEDVEVMALPILANPTLLARLPRPTSSTVQPYPWNVLQVRAPSAWVASRGDGVRVAILDTGVQLSHPDLAGRITASKNIIRPRRSADDDNGHGTHVAGIIAATDNSVGVVGVAPSANLLVAKVLDYRGRGYISDIIAGLDWAVASGAKVVNLSLGLTADVPSLHAAIDTAIQAGVTVVAAAGNDGGAVSFPAAYPEVIAVGATDQSDSIAPWSSRGMSLDVVAPGENITSTYRRSRYAQMSGTSMAAPHVTAAAALLEALPSTCDTDGNGKCAASEIEARLRETAQDLLTPGYDANSGAGRLDVARALGL